MGNSVLFTEGQIRKLESVMVKYTYQRQTDLCQTANMDNGLLMVKTGKVKVTVRTEDGRAYMLYVFQRGDMFSMFSFLRIPNCEVIVAENSTLGFLNQRQLEALFYEDPALASTFVQWCETMNTSTMVKTRDLLMFGKSGALASTLIRLLNSYGERVADGIRINLKLTNEDLAKLIGSSRESVNRLLRRYEDLGVIRYDRRMIVVKNKSFLEKQHGCMKCPREICHA
jgi:CRP/FNR family transcriptional regulator